MQNASVATKSILTPAFCCFVMAVIVGVFYWSYLDVREAWHRGELAGNATTGLLRFSGKLAEGQVDLLKAVTWKAANVEQKLVDSAKQDSIANIQTSLSLLKKIDLSDLPLDAAALVTAEASLEAYLKAVRQTVDMIDIDVFSASMFLTDAIDKFNALRTLTGNLSNQADRVQTTINADAADRMRQSLWTGAGVAALGLLLSLATGYLLARTISIPVRSITSIMKELAGGNFEAKIGYEARTDEIGEMAKALQVFKEALIAKKAADEAAALESGAKILRGQRVDEITREFETAIGEIVDMVSSASGELERSAITLTQSAERSEELTSGVEGAHEEAATNVQSAASAAEEMACSINEIRRQVQEAARIAGEAVRQAQATNGRVGQLAKSATRIGDVVALIDTIAGQTNLLALNATIEAARAGEVGRGFSVVAAEVKALAEQTAKATGEISQQVHGIQAETNESVGAIKEISETIERMCEIASAIASTIDEQSVATEEICRNVQHAAQGTHQVSVNMADVRRGASEAEAASAQVLASAKSLAGESGRLKREVFQFLAAVRAA